MDMKRILTGAVVGGIAMMAAGYVIWGMLMADWFAANSGSAEGVWREEQIWWAIALGNFSLAALLTAIIDKCDDLSVMSGFKWAGVIGFMVWLGVDMILYGNSNLGTLTGMLVDPVLELVRWGVAGAAIAWVLGMGGGSGAASAPSSEY
jgi:hypothetical protein